jgi:hypothetical protein
VDLAISSSPPGFGHTRSSSFGFGGGAIIGNGNGNCKAAG